LVPRFIHRKTLAEAPPAVDSPWIEAKMREAGLSLRKLAKLMDMDPTRLHHLIKGKRHSRLVEMYELARQLHVSGDEMARRLGVDVRGVGSSRVVRVRNVVGADLDLRSVGPGDIISAPWPPGVDARSAESWQAVRVEGVASRLAPIDGAVIYYRARHALPPPGEFLGRVCVVRTNGLPAALRVVRATKAAGKFDLCDLDGSVVEAARSVSSVSPIEWVRV
jgi:hypothetical protein